VASHRNSISVVIPFYRRQDTFPESLNSVLSQTIKPLEIIVVDDASGGDATKYLEQYGTDIKLVTLNTNVGVSEARNVGARAAKGDFIAFLDSDDTWESEKLAKQITHFENHPECNAVHTGTKMLYSDGSVRVYVDKPRRLTKNDLINSSQIMCQSLMIRRKDFLLLGGFDKSFRQTEDYEFSMRMVVNGFQVDFIPEPLVIILRGRSDHLSNSWKGYIAGHIRVVWKYAFVYREVDGFYAVIKHTGRYLISGGLKRGGILGRMIHLLGRCLYPTYKLSD